MAVYGAWVDSILNPYMSGMSVKAMLVDASYVQGSSHQYRSDVTELSATGYPAGGVPVDVSVDYVAGDYQLKLTASSSVYWGAIDVTNIGGVVFYEDSGSAATDKVIAYDPFRVEVTGVMEFYYTPNVDGLVLVTFDVEGA